MMKFYGQHSATLVCTALVTVGPGSTGRDLNKPRYGTCCSLVVMAARLHRRHMVDEA
jgi:hypothetical protein